MSRRGGGGEQTLDTLRTFESNLHSILPATKQRQKAMSKLMSEEGNSVRSLAFSRTGTFTNKFAGVTTKAQQGFIDDFSKQVTALKGEHPTSTASRGATSKFNRNLQ